ncbi:LINE-1 retrotransposable element ORF1 protein [Collichthys lucidus]|uniref:LINE-1 retrotransposable element ORF1 protein n=1 Tax=Collichthys lucidus TaxID=240159 RepID=A0A4V6AQ62_COLLU|nr:LINE-1 retrotransposable element ORF1 protein [Collichthys lucidus]
MNFCLGPHWTLESPLNVTIITELRRFRQEVNETLEKLSEQVSSLDHTVRGLGGRVSEVEERVSNVEDEHSRHGQLLSFLLHRDRQLEARCEALENAQRRENLRIYGIKEGSEQGDTVEWIDKFLHELLKLPPEFELRLDRAHRSLAKKKPAGSKQSGSPRSFIVKFHNFRTKQLVLQKAWQDNTLTHKEEKITLSHDYSPAIQKRRMAYGSIKKQLKAKHIKFQSPYPAKLRVLADDKELVFDSAWEAADGLRHLGIEVDLPKEERRERDLHSIGWTVSSGEDSRATTWYGS